MTASQFAQQINAGKTADTSFRLCEDQEFWSEQGVHTAEELRRHLAISEFEECWKEEHGFRLRRDWTSWSVEEIEAEIARRFFSNKAQAQEV